MNFVCARAGQLGPDLYDSLARYRHEVFVERLGWKLETTAGYEQDQFDHDDTVHVVARNGNGEIVGCGRLLPTTDRYLLESVFPALLNGLPVPREETVWELSRFAAMDVNCKDGALKARRLYLAERVLLEALRFCAARGVMHLLAVTTLGVERLMLRAGVDVQRIGPPQIIDGQPVLAFVIGVNPSSIASLSNCETSAQGRRAAANTSTCIETPSALTQWRLVTRESAVSADAGMRPC